MKVIEVADAETETEVRLADGETFEVRLPETATTGYQWSVKRMSDAVELLGDDVIVAEPLLPGAQGSHRFRFAARGAPNGRVVLELRRAWEDRADPEARFEIKLTETGRTSALEDGADEGGVGDFDDDL